MDEKKVFSEIEFYLPQFAHWIVHMYEESSDALDDLSKFALILSQISTHTALQLTFMLIAYLEDYQPENSDGLGVLTLQFPRHHAARSWEEEIGSGEEHH